MGDHFVGKRSAIDQPTRPIQLAYLYPAPESLKRLNGTGGQSRTAVRFQCQLEGDRSGDSNAGGRRFHVAGPLTAKLRCPVAVRAPRTSRVPVAANRTC